MQNKIPTHDPYTGELNPYYEELTGEKNPLSKVVESTSFDTSKLLGRKFRHDGDYGLSTWTDTVKSIEHKEGIVFDRPLNIRVLKNGEKPTEKINIVGFKYYLYVVSSKSEHYYKFENCVFVED